MRERTRKVTWNREGKPPKLVPIAKCKKCGSWVDLPNYVNIHSDVAT
jgi:hypothetical protein